MILLLNETWELVIYMESLRKGKKRKVNLKKDIFVDDIELQLKHCSVENF